VVGVAIHMTAAIVAHAAFPRPVATRAVVPQQEWSVDLFSPPTEPPRLPAVTGAEVATPSRSRSASPHPVAASTPSLAATQEEVVGSSEESEPALLPLPSATSTPTAAAPRAVDLGLDGRWALLPRSDRPAPSRAERAQLRLDAVLAEDRAKRGQGRGVALIAPLSAAVRAAGPLRGAAIIVVAVDAGGNLRSVQLTQGSQAEWSAAVNAFRERAKSKHIALPSGARGMTLTLSVRSSVTRPSGKSADAATVQTKKPAFEPDGLTLRGGFDVGDAAGTLQRTVTAELLSEEVL
jgi:hypothetical protein